MQVFLVKNQQRIFRTNIYVGILPVFFPKLFAFIYDEVSKVAWCARNAHKTMVSNKYRATSRLIKSTISQDRYVDEPEKTRLSLVIVWS
jgi:hypothetical protein